MVEWRDDTTDLFVIASVTIGFHIGRILPPMEIARGKSALAHDSGAGMGQHSLQPNS
jgi:hypothetical protein